MSSSVKNNFIFNLINTLSQLLFPLITFPYVSRILLADGVGQVSFYQAILSYISLVTSLGIPVYAVRKIAMVRDNKKAMSRNALEIITLHLFLTIIGYFAVIILGIFVPKINKGIDLFAILSTSLIFTTIGCEWFYQATENFRYITIRGLIVKLVSIAILFIFVKDRQDILWYGFYVVIGSIGGNIFNAIHLREYISLKDISIKKLKPLSHLIPSIRVAVLVLISTVYISLNAVMLGFIQNDTAVGYYTAAQKIYVIALSIASSLTIVMMPRIANLIEKKDKESVCKLVQKSYDISTFLTLPLSVGIFMTSWNVIPIFCGESFSPSIITLQIMAPMVCIVAICSVIGMQTLYPMGYLNILIKGSILGCIIDLIACILIIPLYAENGAALAYLLAETSVLGYLIIKSKGLLSICYFSNHQIKYTIGTIVMLASLYILNYSATNELYSLMLKIIIAPVIYISTLLILKDELVKTIIKSTFSKIFIIKNKHVN